jgi:arylsulfatase A-like enzyme
MTDRPNFLFFMTDQHRADWLGCYDHPIVKTPNIDALAARGTKFTDFHVASPICMPNRASFLTGRYPSLHGLRYNGCSLPERANTFVDVLAAGGYRTASIGKSHLQPFFAAPNPPLEHEGPAPLIDEAWKPDPDRYEQEQPGNYDAETPYQVNLPYYGFRHVEMVTGHGDRCGGNYQQWFRQNCPNWKELTDPANELPHDYSCHEAYRTAIPEEFYPTTWIANRAIDYVNASAAEADPFFAFVSFPDPHHPFNPPGKYWDMYHPDQFELGLPYEAHSNPTPPMRVLTERWQQGQGPEIPQSAFRADPQQIREAMALTAGMITMIDDQIGRVLKALRASGQLENTVVVFNSDHGEYLGDFGMMLKGALPFRSVTRVPMIWSDPGSPASRTSNAMASTVDLSATILDRAGLTPYHGIQGSSFLHCIDSDDGHRDELFVEYNDRASRMGMHPPARMRSLRNKEWRLTTFGGHNWGEFYDLVSDSNETNNLWDDPNYSASKAEMSLCLIQHLTAQMDESPRSEKRA